MSSVYEKAALGQPQALRTIITAHKDTLFAAATCLVKQDDTAFVVLQTFKEVLSPSVLAAVKTEDDFKVKSFTVCAELCKKQLTRQNNKGMRVPQDRRFDILSPAVTNEAKNGTPTDAVFAVFSDLQRMIFVLHTALGLSDGAVMQVTKLDKRTLDAALDAQNSNIDRIFTVCGNGLSAEAFTRSFIADLAAVKASEDVTAQLEALVKTLSADYEAKRKKRTVTVVVSILAVCLVLCGLSAAMIFDMSYGSLDTTSDTDGDTTTTTTAASSDITDTVTFGTDITPTHYAEITVQDHGTIKVALDAAAAPVTVENFKTLADSDFYDGLTFHRIIEGFMMQGGDPAADGTGGSDKNITGEFTQNGHDNHLSHVRGAISMARATDFNSASSQFFIVHEDSTFLDGQYAAFGYVTEGMDIVDTICTQAEPGENGIISADDQPIITDLIVYEAES